MNILFYYPSNTRTIPIDVALFELQQRGHKLFLLTTSEEGTLHDLYRSNGTNVHVSHVTGNLKLLRFIRQVIVLVRFCKKNKIDIVHSHLQQTNVIAVVARLFLRSTRIVVFRHHCKFHFLVKNSPLRPSFNERFGDRIINKLAQKIIVPSRAVLNAMLVHEKVSENKIAVIPYIYDFDTMKKVNLQKVDLIKNLFPARLRIIMVSRLTPYKRHMVGLAPLITLIREGLDIQVLIMDDGPEKKNIHAFIEKEGVVDKIHLLGFQPDIIEYISAADIIIHPSLTEASNSAIKEAAILEKIVMVCDHVGDFNEYIVHRENGFLLSPENFSNEALMILKEIYSNPGRYGTMGKKIHDSVVDKFKKSKSVVDLYENL